MPFRCSSVTRFIDIIASSNALARSLQSRVGSVQRASQAACLGQGSGSAAAAAVLDAALNNPASMTIAG